MKGAAKDARMEIKMDVIGNQRNMAALGFSW
jgi:hypothetical protein